MAEITVNVHLDGQQVFRSVQRQAMRYQTRSSGRRTGLLVPGTSTGGA